ncbi:MAG: uroporphyrinogen decarboxylase family protein, partial [Acidiferrobacterales bacterium]
DKVAIMGNVKSVVTVLQGTEEQVAKESRACFEAAAAGGRYIFSNDCAVPRDTPSANVRAMANIVKECGTYPM